jgi:hypothetical protein
MTALLPEFRLAYHATSAKPSPRVAVRRQPVPGGGTDLLVNVRHGISHGSADRSLRHRGTGRDQDRR